MTFEDILSHAAWVFEETSWIDINDPEGSDKAFRAAIEAALSMAQRSFMCSTRDDILEKAVDLSESENDIADDGVAALIWYAKLLDETLPPEQQLGGI